MGQAGADKPLREEEHAERAERHRKIGDLLGDAGDEWAAVPWFYSAYHRVKRALLVDPIWDNPNDLVALNPDLQPEDRFTNRHHGRRRPGGAPMEWGVNQLVLKLYRPAAGAYNRLHQASISVRYGTGLPAGALPVLRQSLDLIEDLDVRGDLSAPIPVRDES